MSLVVLADLRDLVRVRDVANHVDEEVTEANHVCFLAPLGENHRPFHGLEGIDHRQQTLSR